MKILAVNQWADGSEPKELVNTIRETNPNMLIYVGSSEARTPENSDPADFQALYDIINLRGVKVYYITGGEMFLPYYSEPNTLVGRLPNCTIISNPLHFLFQTYSNLTQNPNELNKLLNSPYPSYNYDRLFISLNNLAHKHRCILMDCLVKNDVLHHGHYSWLNRHKYDAHFKHYNGEIVSLDDPFVKDMVNMWKPPHQFFKTPINIVSESDPIIPFYTEKTWLPIAFSKMFLIQGAVGINTGITKYGFRIFDNLIDYSFDFVQDMEERTDLLTQQVKLLHHESYDKIANITKEVREHNRKRFIEIARQRLFIPEFLNWVNDQPVNSFVKLPKPIYDY